MTAEMETAWGHVPALRYCGYTSAEYRRIQYELKHREIPSSTIVELTGVYTREETAEWFRVRIQIGNGANEFDVKPEDVVLWLNHYVLHIKPTGEAFAYYPDGTMVNIITER